jgi:hypothetical protein
MRVFARRERPHPGAQLTLFEAEDGWRYTHLPEETRAGAASPPTSTPPAACTPGPRTGSGPAIAYVMKDDVDAASAQLGDVLALGPAFRITTISSYLEDLDARLAQCRVAATLSVRDLRDQIAAFRAAAHPALVTSESEVR